MVAGARNLLKSVKPWDRMGLLRERFILDSIVNDRSYELKRLQFLRDCAAAQYIAQDEGFKVFNHHWERAHKLFAGLLKLSYPWLDIEAETAEMEKSEYEKDRATWEGAFGEMNNPEVQEEVDRLIAKLKSSEPASED